MKSILVFAACMCGVMHLTSAQPEGACAHIPTIPRNGNITYTPTLQSYHTDGTRAEYVCDPGYTNAGPQIVIYCHDGMWIGLDNDNPTRCELESSDPFLRDCQTPESTYPKTNLVQTGGYNQGNTVTFMCVPGYYMYPPLELPVSHCINGGWTKPAPSCIEEGHTLSPPTTKPTEKTSPAPPGNVTRSGEAEHKTTDNDGIQGDGSDSSSVSSSTGVIIGSVVTVLILMVIAFIGVIMYRSRNKERPPIPRPSPPPPMSFDTSLETSPPRTVSDDFEIPYSQPDGALRSRDVSFGTPVDDLENTYNVTIRVDGNRQQNAVARVIHDNFTMEDKEAMEREIAAVFKLPLHYGVIRPIAEINEEDVIGVFTEQSPKGSLRSYLRNFSDARNSVKPKARELISYALQIAQAMKFLHEEERVCPMLSCHRVMLFRDNVCKVPILGLKRINDTTDLYRYAEARLPVKWMAPESIDYQIFTKKSDVWAFGVVLYEIVTLGGTPYEGIASDIIPGLLNTGYRLEKPPACGDKLFAIMQHCWQQEPRDRPSFDELVVELRELKDDVDAICFGPDYIERPSSRNPFSAY